MFMNLDPLMMTLVDFMARSTEVAYAFESCKIVKSHFRGKTWRKWANGQKIYVYENILVPGGLSAPLPLGG